MDKYVETTMEKAIELTVVQTLKADEILASMGVTSQHPQHQYLKTSVMQTLATNFLSFSYRAKG